MTAAFRRGIAGLIKDADAIEDVVVARHGRPVAALVSVRQLDRLRELEGELRDAALVIIRAATDSGTRTSLDQGLEAFGLDRVELESEVESDLTAGRS
ncbi:type II toxin-antitoxin system prevent-host-death family antitoxin [Paenarthrobacter sp. Z7-10]|uniref:type II toxin-antitoxin system Phd/YefM family antitoxin n=1 Tax=Paenarthrobacter sp. Z7-10 TaxID=2787635 RepID=UPI0022A8FA43|nr:type II toxin-antitoxin system prevent-host-death family antitoxin [Paenarthrobacter sp. Z7-10]MCZ2404570.1 type II toxin-antitoxin system prevent-host-death family antitoxin [Paenarthrobacter sp. Z7-10]